MKFRKVPVVIDAVQVWVVLQDAASSWDRLPSWLSAAYEKGDIVFCNEGIHINTLEGRMLAGHDDWLIRGVAGEIYPCKAEIFNKTYMPA